VVLLLMLWLLLLLLLLASTGLAAGLAADNEASYMLEG
jgi:hypothetical protein